MCPLARQRERHLAELMIGSKSSWLPSKTSSRTACHSWRAFISSDKSLMLENSPLASCNPATNKPCSMPSPGTHMIRSDVIIRRPNLPGVSVGVDGDLAGTGCGCASICLNDCTRCGFRRGVSGAALPPASLASLQIEENGRCHRCVQDASQVQC